MSGKRGCQRIETKSSYFQPPTPAAGPTRSAADTPFLEGIASGGTFCYTFQMGLKTCESRPPSQALADGLHRWRHAHMSARSSEGADTLARQWTSLNCRPRLLVPLP